MSLRRVIQEAFTPNMSAEDNILGLTPSPAPTPTQQSPIASSQESGLSPGGDMSNPIFSGKDSFTSIKAGFRMGIDPSDGLFKWIIGSSFSQIDFNVTSPGVLTVAVPQSGAGLNGIVINDNSFDAGSALQVNRTNGLSGAGDGVSINSSAGPGLRVVQTSNTSSIFASGNAVTGINGGVIEARALSGTSAPAFLAGVYGSGHGAVLYVDSTASATSVPLETQQYKATSTNFYKHISMNSAATIETTLWNANNTTPEGTLTGEKGDLCLSSNGKAYLNQNNGTVWADISGWRLLATDTASGGDTYLECTFATAPYLKVYFTLLGNNEDLPPEVTFNGDATGNYSTNYAHINQNWAQNSNGSNSAALVGSQGTACDLLGGEITIINPADGSRARVGYWETIAVADADPTIAPAFSDKGTFKWGASAQITTIRITNTLMDTGSTMYVYGSS